MEIVFKCPHCKSTIEADSDLTGVRAECPACNEVVLVPAPGINLGMTIGGFQIEKRLGVGGMGEVFAAKQVAMDRQVALKILPPALTNDERQVNRFLHEVRMAAKLEHTNIVTAFDAGQADGYYYLAMSFVEGEDLDRKLKREKQLREVDALGVVIKIAGALEYAWTRFQMLHRDIKPANIMIDSAGEVKLMDMGIAKSLEEDSNLTMQGTLVGTPYYMSPEQATASRDIDCRSDIYSLGATLYHLVTGKRPFEGPNAMAIIAKHITETPKPVSELNAEVTPGTCNLIEKMMSRNRDDRHADWGELQREVIRNMSNAPTLTDAIPPSALVAVSEVATVVESPPVASNDTQEKLGITLDDNLGLKPKVSAPTFASAPTQIAPPLPQERGPSASTVLEGGPAVEDVKGFKVGIFMAAASGVLVILVLAAVIFLIASQVGKNQEELKVKKREQDIRNKEIDNDIATKIIKHDQRKEEKAKEMLRRAHAFADEFPTDTDKIKERFGKVVEFAKINELPEYEVKAEDDLREVLADRKRRDAQAQDVMAELKNRARVLAKNYQILPAALVFEGYKGPAAEATQDERRKLADEYKRRANELRPLEDGLRKALALLIDGRNRELKLHMDALKKKFQNDTIAKINLFHMDLVTLGHVLRPRGPGRRRIPKNNSPFPKAFYFYREGDMERAMVELDKVKHILLAQIMRGEIRKKQAQGHWESTEFSGSGYTGKVKSITLDLKESSVVVTADGSPYLKGRGWFLGDWFYMANGGLVKCWQFESGTKGRVVIRPAEGVRMTMVRR